MKKILIFVIIIAILAWGGYRLAKDDSAGQEATSGVNGMVVRGTVTAVDLEQAMADGPYVVTVKSAEDGSERDIQIPSMGIRLCANPDAIASPSEIKVGDSVEAKGALTSEGAIVPCESSDHYFKKI